MKTEKNYMEFIQSIRNQILQSRYAAVRLATGSNFYFILELGNNFRQNKGTKVGSQST